jgi:hypothetical protein
VLGAVLGSVLGSVLGAVLGGAVVVSAVAGAPISSDTPRHHAPMSAAAREEPENVTQWSLSDTQRERKPTGALASHGRCPRVRATEGVIVATVARVGTREPAGGAVTSSSDQDILVKEIRTPAAAAVAGILFSLILIAVLVLLHTSLPAGIGDARWAADSARRAAVRTAVSLIPFAGIFFLWFIGVIRTTLGDREDKLIATVILGSGVLFVGLLFTSAAFLTTLLTLYDRGVPIDSDTLDALQVLTRALMGTFGTRMAAVFMVSVTSLGMRTGVLPRWLVLVGIGAGILLLLSPPLTAWVQMVFPTWVLLVSLTALFGSRRQA